MEREVGGGAVLRWEGLGREGMGKRKRKGRAIEKVKARAAGHKKVS